MNKILSLAALGLLALPLAVTPALANNPSNPDNKSTGQQAADYVDDATISTKVRTAIVSEKNLDIADVDVTTEQNVVILTGNVATEAQKDRAEAVAKNVDGVRGVKNMITVRK